MLNDRERKLLVEIEHQLMIESPALVRSFAAPRHPGPPRHHHRGRMITAIAGLTLCVVLLIGPDPLTAAQIARRHSAAPRWVRGGGEPAAPAHRPR